MNATLKHYREHTDRMGLKPIYSSTAVIYGGFSFSPWSSGFVYIKKQFTKKQNGNTFIFNKRISIRTMKLHSLGTTGQISGPNEQILADHNLSWGKLKHEEVWSKVREESCRRAISPNKSRIRLVLKGRMADSSSVSHGAAWTWFKTTESCRHGGRAFCETKTLNVGQVIAKCRRGNGTNTPCWDTKQSHLLRNQQLEKKTQRVGSWRS